MKPNEINFMLEVLGKIKHPEPEKMVVVELLKLLNPEEPRLSPGSVHYVGEIGVDGIKELQDNLKETEQKLSVAQSEMMGYDDNLVELDTLRDKLIKVEQQRDEFRHKNLEKVEMLLKENIKLSGAIVFLIAELNDNKHYYECCNKILKNWGDYRKKHGL